MNMSFILGTSSLYECTVNGMDTSSLSTVFLSASPSAASTAVCLPDSSWSDRTLKHPGTETTGSGAEYNKQFDIISAKEEDIGKHIPHDAYGFAKYIMNQYARTSSNVYNFRLFGIYGPTDCKGKFIRDAIDCCLENRAVTIRQNCMFDYLYVDDLGHILAHFIEHEPQYHDYNICSGKRVSLLEIAKEVSSLMNNHLNPVIAKEGWNREYTGSNERLISEFPQFKFTSLEAGITKQIKWQREL